MLKFEKKIQRHEKVSVMKYRPWIENDKKKKSTENIVECMKLKVYKEKYKKVVINTTSRTT